MGEHDELLPVFIEESQQHLQNIEPDLLSLEQDISDPDFELVNRIFRSIHSIKGAAGFFGLQNIGHLSHIMESSLSLLRDGKITPTTELVDALLTGADTLKAMLDDVGESEHFDIHSELEFLQKIVDEYAGSQKKVAVAEKKAAQEQHETSPGKPEPYHFQVSENDVRHFIRNGLHLYAIKIYLNKDIRQKGKTPYDFINNMEQLGQYVDSFLDMGNVTGLSDCLDNDLAFDFLFATVLDPDTVPKGIDLPKDRIRMIDLDKFKEELEQEEAHKLNLEAQIRDLESRVHIQKSETPTQEETPAQEPADLKDKPAEKTVRQVQTEEKIRVGVNFLNELVNLAGELVLGRNQLMQVAFPLVKNTPGLNPVLQHISRVTSEMQEKIMQMRMQPISLVFDKFHRVVRSLAKNHNKEVKLKTSGGDVELDKSIIEGLSDPLTHLIRNAVDHGIESPEEREATGKPRYGTIELRAYSQGGQVYVEASDDGMGIDGDFVSARAFEKGLISQEQLNSMVEKDKVRLIFRPGFSTVKKVTDLSGRGVGMDVVMTNIEHLGGTVDIETKIYRGTKVKLMLPLTLAIVSGLLIKADTQFFILPEVDIDELVRVKPDEIKHRINIVQDACVLRLREMLLPLVDLNEVLGLKTKDPEFSILNSQNPLRILVIKHGISRFGLIVDSIESTEEIVVKPLPRYLKKMKTFSGVSILGNGKVSLILDAAGILKKANIRHLEDSKDEIKPAVGKISVEQDVQTLLLFDNNTEERFALPLELISRIERVNASRIEHIKEKQFLQYHGKKLRLIFLEDYLPVNRPERTSEDSIGIVVPKQIKYPIGIVINQVINTIETVVDLDTTTITAPGLFGSAVLDGKITLLPDMYRLFEFAAPEWYSSDGGNGKQSGRKPRILLAEDTPFFRMVESEYLTSAGYEVIPVENGSKAMQVLEEQSVDAVILDIVMPKMNGWDTIKAIRADERLKHLPVMAVTSLSEEGLAQKGLQAGFDEWQLKLDKTKLLEKLAEIITK
ncbi:MAG: hybrid sensor histidine kinase/response regulator [Desulfobacterales bacterium]|nr:hybrid sensor histidine kinase/response regulator [Desulfobacterales bacterium]